VVFGSLEFALSNSVPVLFISAVVSMAINRRHWFQSDLRMWLYSLLFSCVAVVVKIIIFLMVHAVALQEILMEA